MDNKITLNLRENAIDSLNEALKKYKESEAEIYLSSNNKKSYKHAILFLSHFVELSLKYFVTKVHPVFIYKNLFEKKLDRSRTISMWDAVNFLQNLHGENFIQEIDDDNSEYVRLPKISKEEQITNLQWLKNLRNDIEHNEFILDSSHVQNYFRKCILIFDTMYCQHHESLIESIEQEHQNLFSQIVTRYHERLHNASEEAKDLVIFGEKYGYINNSLMHCTSCGEETFVLLENREQYRCTMSGYSINALKCFMCGRPYPQDVLSEWNDVDFICKYCEDEIFDMD